VWTGLYALIALSGYRVWREPRSRQRRRALGLWGAQLLLNAAWSPLFFGLRRPLAALVDVVLLTGTAAAYAATARRVDRPAAIMMLPYLGWLGYATALNEEIWRLNRK
jgi:translocator protein